MDKFKECQIRDAKDRLVGYAILLHGIRYFALIDAKGRIKARISASDLMKKLMTAKIIEL